MLELKGVSGGYGKADVLWDVDLRIGDEEIVALVGSNGAGKTTLLRAISGVVRRQGSVMWNGKEIAGLPPERIVELGIAHAPEGRRLFAGLTVRENLLMGAFTRRDERVAEDLERIFTLFPRLGERLDQVAGRLSGGEQQMCAIARGIMSSPQLLMIDELSLGLAPKVVDELLERLKEISTVGMSILLVEQDVDAALDIAARGYVLETGHIVAEGPSSELLSDPRIREAYLGVA